MVNPTHKTRVAYLITASPGFNDILLPNALSEAIQPPQGFNDIFLPNALSDEYTAHERSRLTRLK